MGWDGSLCFPIFFIDPGPPRGSVLLALGVKVWRCFHLWSSICIFILGWLIWGMLQLGYQIDWQRKEVHDGGVMGAEKTNKLSVCPENSWAVWAFTRWHAVKYWVVNKDPEMAYENWVDFQPKRKQPHRMNWTHCSSETIRASQQVS